MSEQATPIVEITGLTKTYGSGAAEVTALDAVDLRVPEGQFITVMGPSGCGKSTLLNLLGGLDAPTAGAISIDGQALGELPDDRLTELRRRRIGFVFQFFNLIPVLDAVENASLPLRLDGAKDAVERATAWWSEWASVIGCTTGPISSPADSNSGWRSLAPCPPSPRWCWPTSRPATLTPTRRARSANCCVR